MRHLGYSPGLVQKLAFFSPYLCVAWAGSLDGAARVIQEMEFVAGKESVSKESFLDYMDTIRNDSQTGAPSFIILVVYKGGEVELLARNATEVRGLPPGMRAFSAGTGAFEASHLLRNRVVRRLDHPRKLHSGWRRRSPAPSTVGRVPRTRCEPTQSASPRQSLRRWI